MLEREAHWQTVYATKSQSEVSWFQARPEPSLGLIADTGLGLAARVVDIGGGGSHLVDFLLDAGYERVTVLDVAEHALTAVRARLGKVRGAAVHWVASDVTHWTPVPASFDLWHDRAVFHFLIDAADRAAYVRTMADAVRPGGQAIVGTFTVDGPEKCSGLPVCRYDAAGLGAAFAPHFRPLAALAHDHVTPAGKVQKFQFVRMARI